MILIIGLGNPGKEYEGTRHNIGREILIQFSKKHELGSFSENAKIKALSAEGKIGKERYVLLLPETFMNKSGEAAKKAKLVWKAKPDRIFVVHDDADIEIGRTKLSFNRDSAGHKGVESVMRGLGTKAFWRFRIGVGGKQPTTPLKKREDKKGKTKHIAAETIVLKQFSPVEESGIKKARIKTVGALAELSSDSPEKVMNSYNK